MLVRDTECCITAVKLYSVDVSSWCALIAALPQLIHFLKIKTDMILTVVDYKAHIMLFTLNF